MAFDNLEDRAGGKDALMPMQIAHNPLLTAREKLELLGRLKADLAPEIAFQVERAMFRVKRGSWRTPWPRRR